MKNQLLIVVKRLFLSTLDSRLSTVLNGDHEETKLPSALVDVLSTVAVKRHGVKVGILGNR